MICRHDFNSWPFLPSRIETATRVPFPEFVANTPKTFGSRQLPLQQAPSLLKQELARFSDDQRFVYYEHVVVSVMQFDDSRVLHA